MTAEPAEAAVQDPPSTGSRQIGIADPDLDLVERQAEHLGADLSKNGIGAGADIGRGAAITSVPSGAEFALALVGTRNASQMPLAMP